MKKWKKESINYPSRINEMKSFLTLLLLLFPLFLFSQTRYEIVPKEHWIGDINFEEKINIKNPLQKEGKNIVVVEFWVKFNDINCFKDWNKLEGVTYYRIDTTTSPLSKDKYEIKMPPTLVLFVDGVKTEVFKAGLDLVLKEDVREIQEVINQIRIQSQL